MIGWTSLLTSETIIGLSCQMGPRWWWTVLRNLQGWGSGDLRHDVDGDGNSVFFRMNRSCRIWFWVWRHVVGCHGQVLFMVAWDFDCASAVYVMKVVRGMLWLLEAVWFGVSMTHCCDSRWRCVGVGHSNSRLGVVHRNCCRRRLFGTVWEKHGIWRLRIFCEIVWSIFDAHVPSVRRSCNGSVWISWMVRPVEDIRTQMCNVSDLQWKLFWRCVEVVVTCMDFDLNETRVNLENGVNWWPERDAHGRTVKSDWRHLLRVPWCSIVQWTNLTGEELLWSWIFQLQPDYFHDGHTEFVFVLTILIQIYAHCKRRCWRVHETEHQWSVSWSRLIL